ncbi:hypothetical protein IV203_012425 [Nitzschia inconspicua]|uniref:Uncharacterized protein n=1 Tax=Nitzschia inconspicua TaxID=303405 RepID=A0A9K3PJS6_9STRA|nr:hypothetical protein IV203_012425 [Nitzschia inconspicua]
MATRHSSPSSHDGFTPPLYQQSIDRPDSNTLKLISPSLMVSPTVFRPRSLTPHKNSTNHRAMFAIKVKFLLEFLKDLGEVALLDDAKTVIAACTRLNRSGDPAYTPLENVLESSLRTLVGNVYWELGEGRARRHLAQQLRRRCTAATALQSSVAIRARPNPGPI